MSKLCKTVPLERVREIKLYVNTGKLSLPEIVAREAPDMAINAAYFNGLWRAEGHVKADGTVIASEKWGAWGYAWDKGPDIRMAQLPDGEARNYLSCLDLVNPWDGPEAKLDYDKRAIGGLRGRSAIGLGPGGLTVLCTGDGSADAMTPEKCRELMLAEGCETALELDSGSSCNCYMGGKYILGGRLVVHTLLLIWLEPPNPLWRVQVGAFGMKSNAEAYRDKLRAAGYPAFVTEVSGDDHT